MFVGSETSKSDIFRLDPSTPIPSNLFSGSGCRYSLKPGILRNPKTRGFSGTETSIANNGSTCLKVTKKKTSPINLAEYILSPRARPTKEPTIRRLLESTTNTLLLTSPLTDTYTMSVGLVYS